MSFSSFLSYPFAQCLIPATTVLNYFTEATPGLFWLTICSGKITFFYDNVEQFGKRTGPPQESYH
jgi:hypothetical protein